MTARITLLVLCVLFGTSACTADFDRFVIGETAESTHDIVEADGGPDGGGSIVEKDRGEAGIDGPNDTSTVSADAGSVSPPPTGGPMGPPGETGAHGETGPPGEMGAEGPAGPMGAPGERGPRGEQGEQGERGERGERGEPGPAGSAGPCSERRYLTGATYLTSLYLHSQCYDDYATSGSVEVRLAECGDAGTLISVVYDYDVDESLDVGEVQPVYLRNPSTGKTLQLAPLEDQSLLSETAVDQFDDGTPVTYEDLQSTIDHIELRCGLAASAP